MSVLARLRDNSTGATVVEFALVAPVFLMLMFGVLELGHMAYVQTILQGAVQDAGRDAGLESGKQGMAGIDDRVRAQVRNIIPNGTISTKRKNYASFFDVGKPEDFTDANGNGGWDADRSKSGLGGADDVVVYTATLTYDHIVPIWKMLGWDKETELSATTTLRNQPFADQEMRTETQICP